MVQATQKASLRLKTSCAATAAKALVKATADKARVFGPLPVVGAGKPPEPASADASTATKALVDRKAMADGRWKVCATGVL